MACPSRCYSDGLGTTAALVHPRDVPYCNAVNSHFSRQSKTLVPLFYGRVHGQLWPEVLVKPLSNAENMASAHSQMPPVRHSVSAPVGVISKVLRILECLQNSSGGLSLKAICHDTGINKSTAHRFLTHLERESYLLRTEGGSYLIGPRLAQMSGRADRSATLQAVARPVLADLWRSTQGRVLFSPSRRIYGILWPPCCVWATPERINFRTINVQWIGQ